MEVHSNHCILHGVYETVQLQYVYQIDDYKTLQQSVESDPQFIWNDIQLSKGKLNKDS